MFEEQGAGCPTNRGTSRKKWYLLWALVLLEIQMDEETMKEVMKC